MKVTELGIVTEIRSDPLKASLPIELIEFGMSIEVIHVFLNAFSPMEVTELGMDTENSADPSKAHSPMDVTEYIVSL